MKACLNPATTRRTSRSQSFARALRGRRRREVFHGSIVDVGKIAELKRKNISVPDQRRAQTGAEPEKKHAPATITAERLHGRVVHDAHRFAERLCEIETDPVRRQDSWVSAGSCRPRPARESRWRSRRVSNRPPASLVSATNWRGVSFGPDGNLRRLIRGEISSLTFEPPTSMTRILFLTICWQLGDGDRNELSRPCLFCSSHLFRLPPRTLAKLELGLLARLGPFGLQAPITAVAAAVRAPSRGRQEIRQHSVDDFVAQRGDSRLGKRLRRGARNCAASNPRWTGTARAGRHWRNNRCGCARGNVRRC